MTSVTWNSKKLGNVGSASLLEVTSDRAKCPAVVLCKEGRIALSPWSCSVLLWEPHCYLTCITYYKDKANPNWKQKKTYRQTALLYKFPGKERATEKLKQQVSQHPNSIQFIHLFVNIMGKWLFWGGSGCDRLGTTTKHKALKIPLLVLLVFIWSRKEKHINKALHRTAVSSCRHRGY